MISSVNSSSTSLTSTSSSLRSLYCSTSALNFFEKSIALGLVDLLEVVDGLGQQLLQQLDLGVGQLDLLDLGQIVVVEDVDARRPCPSPILKISSTPSALSASLIISRTLAFICAVSGALPLVSLKMIERTAR